MKKIANLVVLGFLVSVVGCSQPEANDEGSSDLQSENTASQSEIKENKNKKVPTKELKIIKEGDLEFESTSLEQTRAKINEVIKMTGAYISDESISSYESRSQQRLEIRVPVENFDTLVSEISKGVTQFDNKNIRVLDITEDYVDTQSRLKVKKALELRYKELLTKANTVEDILAIEEQIGTLREVIESAEGKLKLYDDRISLSTLNVTYYQKTTASVRFSTHFQDGFINGWRNLIWVLVGVVNIWPFVLILIIAGFGFQQSRKNKKGKLKAEQKTQTPK